MVRYADDFVVLCRSSKRPKPRCAQVEAWVAENGLTLASGQDACW